LTDSAGVQWGESDLLFEPYRFDNLDTDESIFIDGWSYLWAAIGGPLYLLIGAFFREAALMVVISTLLGVVVTGSLIVIVGLFDNAIANIVTTLALPLVAAIAQSIIAIQLKRAALIARGWREGY
jgi:hypothetical protein